MLPGFLEAIRVLTILPLRGQSVLSAKERAFFLISFPLIGAFFGLLNAALVALLWPRVPFFIAWFIPLAGLLLSGVTHFFEVCRTTNALTSRGTVEQRLKLLSSDSVSSIGNLTGVVLFSGKSCALMQAMSLDVHTVTVLVCFMPVFSRYLAVLLALGSSAVEGISKLAILRQRLYVILATSGLVLGAAVIAQALMLSLLMLVAALIAAVVLQAVALRKLGTVPPAVLGALVEISELVMLWTAVLACGLGLVSQNL